MARSSSCSARGIHLEDKARSVRQAFASERLQNSWKLLSCTNDGDRAAALGGIVRLLAKEGLTLDDVLETLLRMPMPPEPALPEQISINFTTAAPVHSELHNSTTRPDHPLDPVKKTLSGRHIPAQIGGRVSLQSERKTRGGPEITVSVIATDVRYEPLKAKDEAVIAVLRQAAEKRMLTQIVVKTVKDGRRTPMIVEAGVGIGF